MTTRIERKGMADGKKKLPAVKLNALVMMNHDNLGSSTLPHFDKYLEWHVSVAIAKLLKRRK